jgi:hypothetical protein
LGKDQQTPRCPVAGHVVFECIGSTLPQRNTLVSLSNHVPAKHNPLTFSKVTENQARVGLLQLRRYALASPVHMYSASNTAVELTEYGIEPKTTRKYVGKQV